MHKLAQAFHSTILDSYMAFACLFVLVRNGHASVVENTQPIVSLGWQSELGLSNNEKNFNKRAPERGDSRGHGRWPATLRSGYRSLFTRTEKSQYLQRHYYPG